MSSCGRADSDWRRTVCGGLTGGGYSAPPRRLRSDENRGAAAIDRRTAASNLRRNAARANPLAAPRYGVYIIHTVRTNIYPTITRVFYSFACATDSVAIAGSQQSM